MNYNNNPNYSYLKSLFNIILLKIGEKNDLIFSWVDKKIALSKIKQIKPISKSKILKMLDDNIALSNSSKNYSFNNMNKTASNKKKISNNQNRSFILKNLIMKHDIQNLRYNHNNNIINSNDNTKKNTNLNKKNIYIEYGDDDIIDERKSVPKFSRSYFYVDWNSNKKTEQFQQKIRLVKKENPLNLTHMNLNKQIPSLDEYKKRYRSKQNLTANSSNNYYSMINNKKHINIKEIYKGDLKEKNYFIYHENKKK